MNLKDKIQIFRVEEDLEDLLFSVAGESMEGEEHDGSCYDVAAQVLHNGIDAQLCFLKEAGWTERQIEAHLFDEDLELEEEMKCHTTPK